MTQLPVSDHLQRNADYQKYFQLDNRPLQLNAQSYQSQNTRPENRNLLQQSIHGTQREIPRNWQPPQAQKPCLTYAQTLQQKPCAIPAQRQQLNHAITLKEQTPLAEGGRSVDRHKPTQFQHLAVLKRTAVPQLPMDANLSNFNAGSNTPGVTGQSYGAHRYERQTSDETLYINLKKKEEEIIKNLFSSDPAENFQEAGTSAPALQKNILSMRSHMACKKPSACTKPSASNHQSRGTNAHVFDQTKADIDCKEQRKNEQETIKELFRRQPVVGQRYKDPGGWEVAAACSGTRPKVLKKRTYEKPPRFMQRDNQIHQPENKVLANPLSFKKQLATSQELYQENAGRNLKEMARDEPRCVQEKSMSYQFQAILDDGNDARRTTAFGSECKETQEPWASVQQETSRAMPMGRGHDLRHETFQSPADIPKGHLQYNTVPKLFTFSALHSIHTIVIVIHEFDTIFHRKRSMFLSERLVYVFLNKLYLIHSVYMEFKAHTDLKCLVGTNPLISDILHTANYSFSLELRIDPYCEIALHVNRKNDPSFVGVPHGLTVTADNIPGLYYQLADFMTSL